MKHQIDELSKEISGALILPEKQIDYAHTNIMDVTTSSIDAYHYFVRGRDEYYRGTGDAEKYLKRAITMDTTFATAYLWLGRVFTPNIAEKNNYLLKAKQYSNRATKKEQLYIEAELEPNYDRKNQLYQQIINQYPKEKYSHYLLVSIMPIMKNLRLLLTNVSKHWNWIRISCRLLMHYVIGTLRQATLKKQMNI